MVAFNYQRVAQVQQASKKGQANILLSQRLCNSKTDKEGIQLAQNALCSVYACQASQSTKRLENHCEKLQYLEHKVYLAPPR